jgi:Uma2 family endonuclease
MPRSQSYLSQVIESQSVTADELLRLKLPGKRTELVRGVLLVGEPAGYRHGEVTARLAARLFVHVDEENLGRVLAAETGFKLTSDPDTVRATDIAFICRERIPDPRPAGYAEFAPDLVVEVLSPEDRPGQILAKVADWMEAGTRVVWVVDPQRRVARVYRADGSESLIGDDGALEGEGVVPGFRCPLAEVV